MKYILSPAVALMNRLSMLQKFGLISVLFLVPLAGLSYLLVSQLNASIDTIVAEQRAMDQLEEVNELMAAAVRYRDYRTLGKSNNDSAFLSKSDKAANAVEAHLDSLTESDVRLDQKGTWREQLESVAAAWETLRSEDILQSNVDPQFQYYDSFVQNVRALQNATIKVSALSRDPSVENQLLLEMTVGALQDSILLQGTVRTFGMHGLIQGRLSSVLAGLANDLYDRLTTLDNELKSQIQVVKSASPTFQSTAGEVASAVTDTPLTVRDELDQKIITPYRLEMAPQAFDRFVSEAIGEHYELMDAIYGIVDANLAARLDAETDQRLTILLALGGLLLVIVFLYLGFFMSVKTAISRFTDAARHVADGDMTVRIKLDNRDELGTLTDEFNNMTARIAKLIRSVSGTTGDVDEQAARVNTVATSNSDAVSRQMTETGQIAEAMHQMVDAVQEVAKSAQQASDTANRAEHDAEQGREVVNESVATINRLAEEIRGAVDVINRVSDDSENISQVLVEIKAIAEQTNLLALNAAIEAARAGEQGRGFAVVADEVRSLAQRTHKSTEDIEEMIGRLQTGVGQAVTAMNNSHEVTNSTVDKSSEVTQALEKILGGISTIVDMSHQIAQASEEQSSVAQDINSNVDQITELGQSTSDNANETLESSRRMSDLTADLRKVVDAFKV
ncbi:methyl-accepting chemotaxis protein [Tamilnaduibacter salinus]|uniref:Methyl-accepting chemotaxis protein n=1 Tax=Tamilnaduibacter salinus TaxID=1484056 RepID=A0A2U1CT16_9GAMM|nr:methyl-accepting chemotaxis protein [Tamilnaduibacter salinus]PVY69585.1 methyl-accepting chemotaxis protein [Tamilnaduibacter salinus]